MCKHGGARAPTMTDQWSRQVENSPLGFWLSWGIVPTHALVSEPPKRRKEDCVEPAGLHARYSKADTLGWYRAAEDSVRIKNKKPHHLQSHDSHFYTHHERIHSHLSVFTFIHFLQEWEKLHTHTHSKNCGILLSLNVLTVLTVKSWIINNGLDLQDRQSVCLLSSSAPQVS